MGDSRQQPRRSHELATPSRTLSRCGRYGELQIAYERLASAGQHLSSLQVWARTCISGTTDFAGAELISRGLSGRTNR